MNYKIAVLVSNLCCYKNELPQGSPCSPIITNFIFKTIDFKILKLSKKFKLDYSRYADDMTFSTNLKDFLDESNYDEFLKEIKSLLNKEGFKVKDSKTRLLLNKSRQSVTGLVVNKKINVPREYYKKTRAMAHSLYKNSKFLINGEEGTLKQLEGRFAFLNQINLFNKKMHTINDKKFFFEEDKIKNKDLKRVENFGGLDRQYSLFLFYKYFIQGNDLIITEGKTDTRYIKAAIMKENKNYPTLINNNKLTFNFFKRGNETYKFSKEHYKKSSFRYDYSESNIHYFLGISEEGGSALSFILNYYMDNEINYYKYFENIYNGKISKKVIILLDNERTGKKPLKIFLNKLKNHIKIEPNRYFYNIKGNLYLLIIPNENGKDADIESLLNYNKKDKNKKTYFEVNNKLMDKNTFSKYILNNYSIINFNKFKVLLDELKKALD